MKTSHSPSKGFQGPNPITATHTWGAVGRAAMQQTSVVCYFIFLYQDQTADGRTANKQPGGWRKSLQPGAAFLLLIPQWGHWGQHL